MPESLSPEIQEKVLALCKQISVAHDLDPLIQKELYGHMEDKLLAYLNGEEPLSEEDALILVRDHFGDPSSLKGLLRNVHAREAGVTLARRLAAAFAAYAAVAVAAGFVHLVIACSLIGWAAWVGSSHDLNRARALLDWSVAVPAVVAVWAVLWRWQRRLDSGQPVWFLTWRPRRIIGLLVAMFIATSLFHGVSIEPGMLGDPGPPMGYLFGWIILLIMIATAVMHCMPWLWWCDRPPRTTRALVVGFMALLMMQLLRMLPLLLPSLALHISKTGFGLPLSILLPSGHFPWSSLHWQFYLQPPLFAGENVLGYLQAALRLLTVGTAACALYLPIQAAIRRRIARD